ncbi:MAG: methanogenesis marker 17 protein [Methanobrevibacter sp.]|jgi:putative methanogenesis marker protein 17|nr:methanogenesis marker 17 protein [Candidatus Methanoflexus mossambicus]
MLVEGPDREGAAVYEMIIKSIFQDLQLSPSVKDMKVYVDPNEVLFIIAIKLDKLPKDMFLSDLATVKYDKPNNRTLIGIKDENYLPDILKRLWLEFGRENVAQPNRYLISLVGEIKGLNQLNIVNAKTNIQKKVYDAIFRIMPEGFRIVRDLSQGDVVAIVSTDELIKDSWLDKGQSFVDELNVL